MCCPCWKPKIIPTTTYQISVAVQPRIVTHSRSVQASSAPPSPSIEVSRSMSSIAHTRFASTDQISLVAALRTSPSSPIPAIPESPSQKDDDKKSD